MRNRNLIFLGATSASAVLLLAVGAGTANATDKYEVGLHQQTPITADDAEFAHDTCPTIPSDQDGWHFVLPGQTTFVELRVTFEDGGEQVITSFGPPTDKHAYVASEPGDTLIAASATVEGEDVDFRLSHTCPASEDEEETTTGGTTSGGTTGGDEGTTGETTTGGEEATTGETTTGGEETTTGETTTGGEETTTGETTTGGEDPADDGADLAETGSSTSVLTIAAGAAALLGVGAYLALRRRRTAQH